MPSESAGTLDLITRVDENFSRGDRLTLVSQALDVGVLRERFADFMAKLQSIVRSDEERAGAFRLAEVQFTAEISANGEFKLVGTGVGVSATSAITFVLRRDERSEADSSAASPQTPEKKQLSSNSVNGDYCPDASALRHLKMRAPPSPARRRGSRVGRCRCVRREWSR